MRVFELIEQLRSLPSDAEVHFAWGSVVYPAIARATEGRVIEPMQGNMALIGKNELDKFPSARTVVLLHSP